MEIRAQGAEETGRKLEESSGRAADLRPLLAVLSTELQAMADRAFATNTSPDGTPWAPRAAAVRVSDGRPARARTETRPGRDLLEDTGELRGSISVTVSGDTVSLSASSGHAGFIQYGTRYMPARPVLPVTRSGPMTSGPAGEWMDSLPDRIAAYILDGALQ